MFAIGIFYLFYIKPSKNSLLRIFIMKGYYSLSDDFSLSWFSHFILLMWWIVVIFPIFTPILYSWNKPFFWSWCIVMLGVPKTTLRLVAVLGALSIQLCSHLRFIRHGPNKRKQREQGHRVKSRRNQAQAAKNCLPVESSTRTWLPQQRLWQLMWSVVCWGDSGFIENWPWRHSLTSIYQNSRLAEGKESRCST